MQAEITQSQVVQVLAVDPLATLSESEINALDKFNEDRRIGREYPLSPTTQGRMFTLYLNGRGCTEIQQLNNQFTLGQVVDACVTGQWEKKRRNHVDRVLARVRDRVVQVQGEAVEFMADMLAVAHKLHGDKLKLYLQTGDEKALDGVAINSLEAYKKAAEILLKLTGQAGAQKVDGQITHRHVLDGGRKALTKDEQSRLLSELAK